MTVKIQSIHFDADKKLIDFIQEKVNKLNQFYDEIVSSEVILKLDNNGENNKITEIRLYVPGNDLFAKKSGKSFEEATDHVVEALTKQIKKHKEKIRGL